MATSQVLRDAGGLCLRVSDALEGRAYEDASALGTNRPGLARQALRRDPRNVVAWLELSRSQLSKGHVQSALHSMKVALSLEPYNRFILRSAAALYVGIGEPDRASALLSTIARDSGDPWIISAEIAVASVAKRHSRLIGTGKSLLTSGRWDERSISELASELATQEADSGSGKNAKRLFKTSLIDPTENALAQARSISVGEPKLIPNDVVWEEASQLAGAWEARAIDAVERSEFDHASDNAISWLEDQPFSPRAAMFASYIASSATEDWGRAISSAEQGLSVDRDDPILLNNLAFSLIESGGDIERARSLVRQAQRIGGDGLVFDACITATKGLLEYRSGNSESGEKLYNSAALKARRMRSRGIEARALAMHAREIDDMVAANRMLERAKHIAHQSDTVLKAMLERTQDRISAGVAFAKSDP